jgi:tetratricopeptide (TPR) repeat protein
LANLFRSTLEPFYGASYDERESFRINSVEELIPNEALSNTYVFDRNVAWVMLGECYLQEGEEEKAISYFVQALEHISLESEEKEYWMRAAQGVMSIVNK